MTNETKTENNATDNKVIFGPLGKYAVIAVIMVSIIVTTAIMLDKQLNTVDQQIATIESEVSKLTRIDSDTSDTVKASESTSTSISAETNSIKTQDTTTAKVAEVKNLEATATEVASTEIAEASVETISEKPASVAVSVTTTESNLKTEQVTSGQTTVVQTNVAEDVAKTEAVATETQSKESPFAMDQQKQPRLETFKTKQKLRMSEMFARIKTLESQQLNQYKTNQENHIVRMRDQITRQQEMIEALILRNKDLFQLRAANVQRIQNNREEVLNRI